MRREMKRMRETLKQQDGGFDAKLQQIQSQAQDYQKNIMQALEAQRTAWETQSARTADQTIVQDQQMVPPVPNSHPEFGPALFDYDRHQWVYPYAEKWKMQAPREEPRRVVHEIGIQ